VWSKEIDKNIETQRLRTIKTIFHLAHNSIKNIIARKVNGEISQEEAIQQISERLRSMIYQDEFGITTYFRKIRRNIACSAIFSLNAKTSINGT
jgi:hypothetical protein